MKGMPFISISEWNVKYISSGSFARFLNWIGQPARTKRQFLVKYSDYSLYCSKERWLCFVKDICRFNGLVFESDRWSCAYDDWKTKGCSYSIHFFN